MENDPFRVKNEAFRGGNGPFRGDLRRCGAPGLYGAQPRGLQQGGAAGRRLPGGGRSPGVPAEAPEMRYRAMTSHIS